MFNIQGVDISNNNSISDLSTLKNNGVEYVYFKSTEGATFQDRTSIYRAVQAKNLGLKIGFYHFLVSTSTPEAQMENAYNYLKNNGLLEKCDLKFALDVERNFSGLSNYVLRAISKWRELSDIDMCIYTYSSFVSNLNGIKEYIKDIPLWIANYTSSYSNVPSSFFTKVCGWQYTENGTIGSFRGDCNLFNELCLADRTIPGNWIYEQNKWWYKHSDGTYTKNGWEKINGKWYLFDEKGWMLYDWKYKDDNWYYLGTADDGAMKTGWILDNGHWYYLNDSGAMCKGWLKYKNVWYYLNEVNGQMATGWLEYDGDWYLLDSQGAMYQNDTAYGYRFDSHGVATKIN